jgi:hypothetical protein
MEEFEYAKNWLLVSAKQGGTLGLTANRPDSPTQNTSNASFKQANWMCASFTSWLCE